MCRQLANTVLPLLPDAEGCSEPDRLVPDTEFALIRHVNEVLRADYAPYPKRVTVSVVCQCDMNCGWFGVVVTTLVTSTKLSYVTAAVQLFVQVTQAHSA